jgi:hypothetical protein
MTLAAICLFGPAGMRRYGGSIDKRLPSNFLNLQYLKSGRAVHGKRSSTGFASG